MKKKWLAGILTICMLLSILPTNALAAGEGADAETGEQENAAIEGTLDTVGSTDSNEALEGKATGVAQIGTTTYATLAEAVEKAGDGDTIELLADVSEQQIDFGDKNVTVDLGTHQWTRDASVAFSGYYIFSVSTGGSVTIQNGKLNGISCTEICTVTDGALVLEDISTTARMGNGVVLSGGEAELKNTDLTVSGSNAIGVSVKDGILTVDGASTITAMGHSSDGKHRGIGILVQGKNDTAAPVINVAGTINAYGAAIQGNGSDRSNPEINVQPGAKLTAEKLAMYLPQPGSVTIKGAEVTGYAAIGIKSGTLTIVDSRIKGVANDAVLGDEHSATNGINTDGSAIVIDSYTGYAGNVELNISGNSVIQSDYSTAIREIGNDATQTKVVAINISGGEIIGADGKDAVMVRATTEKTVNITGGTFSSDVGKYLSAEYGQNEKGEVGPLTEGYGAEAMIGTTGYKTLAEALTAATDGDTVTLLKDVDLGNGSINIYKSITVDLNGCVITGSNQTYTLWLQAPEIILKDSKGTGAVKNTGAGSNNIAVVVNASGTNARFLSGTYEGNYAVYAQQSNSVVIEDGTYIGRSFGVNALGADDPYQLTKLEINGGEIRAKYYAVAGNGGRDYTRITINGGTLSTTDASVVFHPQIGDLEISGDAKLTGPNGVQYCGAGTLTIADDAVITATGAYTEYPSKPSDQGDGSANDGAALSLISRGGGYQSSGLSMKAEITGGTLTSENNAAIAVYRLEKVNGHWVTSESTTLPNYLESLQITGGRFSCGDQKGVFEVDSPAEQALSVTGGKFTADPSKYVPEDTHAVFSINEGNYKFVVGKAVTSITLSDATLSLALNDSHTLTATVEPDDAYAQTVTWASNNETVATVDQNGVVTAEAIGKATITATIGDKSASCEVTVSYAPVANVTLDHDKLSMVEGGTTTITATVTPNNADQTVVWTSDKASVATVESGKITAIAPGTATITATVGGKFASCVVTVVAKPNEDETAVVPSVEEPAVKVDAELPQAVGQAVTEAAKSVDAGQALTGAAQQEAAALDRNEAKQAQLLDKAKDEGITGSEDTPVVLYTQTYLEIQVTEAKAEGSEVTSVTMDITPKMQIVASTAASSADIDLEGTDKNAVVVESSDLSLTRAEITVQLPGNFAQELVFIRHEAEKGVFHYQDQADAQGVVTFTTRHGFSPFTFSLTDGAAAWIGSAGYDTLAQAVDAVDNGETITLARDNSEEIQVNREVSFSVAPGEHKFDQKNITAGRRYDMSVTEKDGVYTYTFERESTGGSTDRPEGDYAIRVEAGKNGTVKVSPSRADKGDTVTITVKPNKGFELDELIVTDSKGNELELTEKGENKFTFKMPGSRVTVEATFQAVEDAPEVPQLVNPFIDVNENAYYYDAVLWAVEKGITGGTTAATFSPDDACTRAQMVTFLWRAAGSPVVNYAMSFTDVPADAYYAEAVRWAVSQGITAGTSATTFSPNATVTRGQTVTFLWRAAGSPVVAGDSFADVAADAYYAPAVAWAVREGITSGVGAETFAPSADCTRGQIVTFLYRDMVK